MERRVEHRVDLTWSFISFNCPSNFRIFSASVSSIVLVSASASVLVSSGAVVSAVAPAVVSEEGLFLRRLLVVYNLDLEPVRIEGISQWDSDILAEARGKGKTKDRQQ